MKTRIITEGELFVLAMNPISGRCEDCTIVAVSPDYERLVSWYHSQKCENYRDGWMNKQFRQGTPLEFYNQVNSLELNECDYWGHGIHSEWVRLDESGKPMIRDDVMYIE